MNEWDVNHIPKAHIQPQEPACFPGLSEMAGRPSHQTWMAAFWLLGRKLQGEGSFTESNSR